MSVHPEIRPRHKSIYFALMAALLFTEFRAMRKDREVNDAAQKKWNSDENNRLANMLGAERENTKNLLDQENNSLTSVLKQDQAEFERTISALSDTHQQDRESFSNVLQKQEKVFEQQHDLSEEVFGRLVPGDDPTPVNGCTKFVPDTPKGGVRVITGDNANIVSTFPHTILEVAKFPVVAVDRIGNSDDLALRVDIRDSQNRVSFRIDKNGVVNRSALIFLHPDKSTFLLQDQFGNEVLKARFLNKNTFEVSGSVGYCGTPFPIQEPRMHNSCSQGGILVGYDGYPCPKPQ